MWGIPGLEKNHNALNPQNLIMLSSLMHMQECLREVNKCTSSPEQKPKPRRKGRKEENCFTEYLNNEISTRLHITDNLLGNLGT